MLLPVRSTPISCAKMATVLLCKPIFGDEQSAAHGLTSVHKPYDCWIESELIRAYAVQCNDRAYETSLLVKLTGLSLEKL